MDVAVTKLLKVLRLLIECLGLGGVDLGPMARWFNNNTFYRAPIITGPIAFRRSVTEKLGYRKLLPKGLIVVLLDNFEDLVPPATAAAPQ